MPLELVPLIFVLGMMGLYLLVEAFCERRERASSAVWRRAGEELGLVLSKQAPGVTRGLDGVFRGCIMEVHAIPFGAGGERTRIAASHRLIPKDLRIGHEGGLRGLAKVVSGEDTVLGDLQFDAAANVRGDEAKALAALSQPARAALSTLMAHGFPFKVEDRWVELDLRRQLDDADEIVRFVQEVAEVATQLGLTSVPEALAWNARHDGVAATRLRNLEALCREHPETPQAVEATEAALADPAPAVRLFAARQVAGDASRAALEALVSDLELPSEVRAEALERLSEIVPYERVAPLVARMLRLPGRRERLAALTAAGRGRDSSLVGPVGELLSAIEPGVAAAAAAALGDIGDPRAEAPLLRALAEDAPDDARREAARALGRLGTVRAVEPLLPLARSMVPGALRDAARDAVRGIQSRLEGADAGRLSLVQLDGSAAAGLSVVDPLEETEKIILDVPAKERR